MPLPITQYLDAQTHLRNMRREINTMTAAYSFPPEITERLLTARGELEQASNTLAQTRQAGADEQRALGTAMANEQQMLSIRQLGAALDVPTPPQEMMTFSDASEAIRQLAKDFNARRGSR